MMAINGQIQREGNVVHLVAQQLFALSGDLSGFVGHYVERCILSATIGSLRPFQQ